MGKGKGKDTFCTEANRLITLQEALMYVIELNSTNNLTSFLGS